MEKLKTILAFLLLASLAPSTHAKDAFYRLTLDEMNIQGDTGPPGQRTHKWGYNDNPMQPYAALDEAGEVYIDFRSDWPRRWQDRLWQGFKTTLLIRAEAGKKLRGTLYLPRPGWSGMNAFAFEVDPQKEKPDARKDFFECKEIHYRRLLDAPIPGDAWFAHEIKSAAKESGRDAQPGAKTPRGAADLAGTFGFLSGTRAVAENLALDRQLAVAGAAQKQTVNVSAIRGVTVKAIDWTPYIKDPNPALDPLAELIPADQHALFLPSFDAAMALMDEGDALAGAILPLGEQRGEDARVLARYQRQLGLSASALARLMGPKLIGETFLKGDRVDFKSLFLLPCFAALAAAVALALFFRPPRKEQPVVTGQTVAAH